MTAKELIQKLQQLEPDTQIVIRGYEDGFNDIRKLIEHKITTHPDKKADYYGEYVEAENGTKATELWGENTKSEN